ncbi:uncharacterized protein SPPG_09571 [Spizellomyces punctatus DAOM BR117]|uniref:Uncharacterized protein n=1 Tax=Spizellomyces punctatus (strain DAOM BR117) TaxID=645134 RepID=A0A0L0H4I3_SPIPD|nr:uncharacterized protein SPPG_09571 [Spizellomyces punctatus DAOM BR117]KNC95889.1 hypothetical protein SPPG_09571 [Spizellomyces punctatus DAOM BR117]|eukprot:XP_016603929.1 hypothetical protein SPPG_09571 [Spizellomyces punctatus DAOM BR117]
MYRELKVQHMDISVRNDVQPPGTVDRSGTGLNVMSLQNFVKRKPISKDAITVQSLVKRKHAHTKDGENLGPEKSSTQPLGWRVQNGGTLCEQTTKKSKLNNS